MVIYDYNNLDIIPFGIYEDKQNDTFTFSQQQKNDTFTNYSPSCITDLSYLQLYLPQWAHADSIKSILSLMCALFQMRPYI